MCCQAKRLVRVPQADSAGPEETQTPGRYLPLNSRAKLLGGGSLFFPPQEACFPRVAVKSSLEGITGDGVRIPLRVSN